MKKFNIHTPITYIFLAISSMSACTNNNTPIPDYPIAGGVSAPFAGYINETLVVAGGCNFPNRPAADGGEKFFYTEAFCLNTSAPPFLWKPCMPLKQPIAYGASIQTPQGIVGVGGQNNGSSSAAAFIIRGEDATERMDIDSLPSLPIHFDNGGGAFIDNRVIVTGGNQTGNGKGLFALNLANVDKGWEKLSDYPGPKRVQPIVLADGKRIYLAGGFEVDADTKESTLSTDILQYDLQAGQWSVLTKLPPEKDGTPRCMVGGSGLCYNGCLVLAGGVNYTIFKQAIEGRAPADYLKRPRGWYRFNKDILVYHLKNKEWKTIAGVEGMDKAGGLLVQHEEKAYMVCGETKPGIRTPEIVALPLKEVVE